MFEKENIGTVVREWVSKAENDFTNATHTLKLGRECPTDTVCFHAQQCVEKYIRALLVWEKINFPRTHEIEKLVSHHSVREQRVPVGEPPVWFLN